MLNKKYLFFWHGFPVCGLLLSDFINSYPNVHLIIYNPNIDIHKYINNINEKVTIIKSPNQIWNLRKKFQNYDYIFHTGWNFYGWLLFDIYSKIKFKSKIILISDNNLRFSIKQILGKVYFKIFLKKIFNAYFTPGQSGFDLLKFLGASPDKIFMGNYGAYSKIYNRLNEKKNRKNEFLFVGQFINRKGLVNLIKAFEIYKKLNGKWNLRIIGNGPLQYYINLKINKNLIVENFLNPETIAKRMKSAKVFVLPSNLEHWGTVVCEAAACGMTLLLSDQVGSKKDLLRTGINGFCFDSQDINSIVSLFKLIEKINNSWFDHSSVISSKLASSFDENSFKKALEILILRIS